MLVDTIGRNLVERGARIMPYLELSLEGFVQEFKSVSQGNYQRKFCFILGAGASKTSGIKTGEELVELWDRELEKRNLDTHLAWRKEQGITEKNKASFYSLYYERRFERDDGKQYRDGYNFLETMMEKASPSSGYIHLALLMSKTIHNVVITTNFDHLLENSLVQYAQVIPLVIGHEKLASYAMTQTSKPTIIKIHRDLLFDPISRAKELECLNAAWEPVLSYIFSQYHPVFIGYAGNDNSVMDFLNQNVDKFNSAMWKYPYWMIYGTQEPMGKVRHFLEETHGYLIRHQGFDQVFMRLCNVMGLSHNEKAVSTKIEEQQKLEHNKALVAEQILVGQNSDTTNNYENSSTAGQYETSNADEIFDKILLERQKAVELEPNCAQYQHSLGLEFYKRKRYAEAQKAVEKAILLDPMNAKYHHRMGEILLKTHQYDAALEVVTKAAKLEPDNAAYQHALGVVLYCLKRYDEAQIPEKKAIELDPMNAKYHHRLYCILYYLQQYEAALSEIELSVKLEPDNADYYNILGFILRKLKRYPEARRAGETAVQLEPDNAGFHSNLAATLQEMT